MIPITDLHDLYKQWCKETKRSGGVLVGSSIKEWHIYLQDHLNARLQAQGIMEALEEVEEIKKGNKQATTLEDFLNQL